MKGGGGGGKRVVQISYIGFVCRKKTKGLFFCMYGITRMIVMLLYMQENYLFHFVCFNHFLPFLSSQQYVKNMIRFSMSFSRLSYLLTHSCMIKT